MPRNVTDSRSEMLSTRERLYFIHPGYIIALSFAPVVAGFFLTSLLLTMGLPSYVRLVLPIFIAVPSFLVMRRWLLKGRVGAAYSDMLLSCLWMSIPLVMLPLYFPVQAEKVGINGTDYIIDMRKWITTGGSTEGTPSLFIPQHLQHMAMIAVASIITGGFGALLLGAIQMEYMNYYISWLVTASAGKHEVYLIGWPLWSLLRVASFVLIAVVLAQPLIHLFDWKKIDTKLMIKLILAAIGGGRYRPENCIGSV
jgi:hypothetical protein